MPSLWLGLRATSIYVALVAAAAAYVFRIGTPPASVTDTLSRMLPFQLIAAIFCLFVAVRWFGWAAVGFGRLNWSGLVWLLPSWVVLGLMFWDISKVATLTDVLALGSGGLALLIVVPFLIAFCEELMFRGILLRGATAALPLMYAMLLSAVLFALMHVINGIAGQGAAGTMQQIVFALLVGFYLAPIAVKLGNLWPLIIWHWLWNIAVFTSQISGVLHPLVLTGIAMQTIVSIWLWAEVIREPRLR